MSFVRFGSAISRWRPRRISLVIAAAALALLVVAGASQATHLDPPAHHTTLQTILTGPNPDNGYANLTTQSVTPPNDACHDGQGYLIRDGACEGNSAIPTAKPGREQRRVSLAYFGQLTDFQLADEESPARVEFLDPTSDQDPSHSAESAWRPQEALQPFIIDDSIRQMNLFADHSPVLQGNGTGAAMDLALMTGDQADNGQRNEIIWTRELLEGDQPLNFNSGSQNPADYDPTVHPSCLGYPPNPAHLAEAARYTGVQDYSDYNRNNDFFYDPNNPQGTWATKGFPTWAGLMDRAQQLTFQPAGAAVPTYVTNGNHEALTQGNQSPNQAFEDIATGCEKALASSATPAVIPNADGPDPSVLLGGITNSMIVPPDPLRRLVDKRQIKALYEEHGVDNGHGYDFVDPAENAASNGFASYYAWDPPQAPGFRFISLDTMSEGGIVAESSSGNIDDPQFQWLKREIASAEAAGKLIMLWGHHPVRSLTARVPDETPGPCDGVDKQWGDAPEHNHNPGCDGDPRSSAPIHLGQPSERPPGDTTQTLVELLDSHPSVIAYVAGHTHTNRVTAFPRTGGGVWWGIETAATADWPVQHRLIEVMDNEDGTLSIFGTVLDHASLATAPASGSAAAFDRSTLATIGRVLAYNDPQKGPPSGEGGPSDKNVELLVPDPRVADLSLTKTDSPDPVTVGAPLTYTLTVSNTASGSADASAVTLNDLLPKNVLFRSARSDHGRCLARKPRTVKCELADIARGDTATVTIVVRPTKAGTITNTASTYASAPTDPVLGNNSASASTQVNP
jgi:uncharacterized repeat protein (TIGR01451 family)